MRMADAIIGCAFIGACMIIAGFAAHIWALAALGVTVGAMPFLVVTLAPSARGPLSGAVVVWGVVLAAWAGAIAALVPA